jgi:hypothetical protein
VRLGNTSTYAVALIDGIFLIDLLTGKNWIKKLTEKIHLEGEYTLNYLKFTSGG